jgi:predicted TIM-barrel fold metal-dependent hydrolase
VRIGDEADYDGPFMTRICDAHCHFLSSRFLELLTSSMAGLPEHGRAAAVSHRPGWDDPGRPDELADRWVSELDRSGVARATIIASIPGDEASVATAVQRHPHRLIGFFMFNPMPDDAASRLGAALHGGHLRGVCLFPAMHGYRFDDERVAEVFATAAQHGAVVFAHCGVLTVGVRKKLGLPSAFDTRLGDPLALAATARRFPSVPVIVPHFGGGMFREALMAADQCGNILFDSSSSNGWMKYYPELTLEQVLRQALAVAGAERILFGTDSSFFPRGWQQSVHAAQDAALRAIGVSASDHEKIFSGNFDRLFPNNSTVPQRSVESSEPPAR